MEPLPETEEALVEYLEPEDDDLRATLVDMGRRATEIVPTLVGLSLGLVREGLTFTLVASSLKAAVLDAVQFLDGGPCVNAMETGATNTADIPDLLDEEAWSTYAGASAAEGVLSSLSLPVLRHGTVVGGINLYASTRHAFAGKQDELAISLGGSAEAAVADADLEFDSRARARMTPAVMADARTVDVAVGALAARDRTSEEAARDRLEEAALRAGISAVQAARVLTFLRTGHTG